MASNRAQLAQLYTPIYDEFMLQAYDEHSMVSSTLFKEVMDKTKEFKVDDLSTLGRWDDVTEGSGDGYEDPVLGYPKTYTQGKKIKKFKVSFEAVDQDEYALAKKVGDAQGMGLGARDKIEYDCSRHFINGFTTAGSDSQYLYDTDHPKNSEETGTTYSNLLSGAFSHDNLEAAETQIAANMMSPAGIPIRPPQAAVLLHPIALRGAVKRVLDDRAKEQPDTTMRNINRFAGEYKAIEWWYIGTPGGGTNTQWHIVFPSLNFFKLIWNQKPGYTSWVDEDLEFYNFKGRMLYASGYDNWRGAFGSTGV